MKDNKGMTIVEILVSVCIISLVLTLLFSLLIQVKEEENNNNIQSNFLINQSTFITQIEEDIINYGVKAIAPCYTDATGNKNDINHSADGRDGNYFYCVKIFFAADYIKDNIGIIQIYNYYQKYSVVDGVIKPDTNSGKWSIRYQRGHYNKCKTANNPNTDSWDFGGGRIMKDMPSEIDLSGRPYITYTASTTKTNAASLVIPIANLDGEHYDINLSFTFKNPIGLDKDNNQVYFICQDEKSLLECRCIGSVSDCNQTYIKYEGDKPAPYNLRNNEQLKKYQCGTN